MNLEEMKLLPKDQQKEIYDKVAAARKKGKTCLPIDNTEVLTTRGWVHGCDVAVGDTVMSYNMVTSEMEWTAVRQTILYKDQEVVKLSSRSWELESTEDHEWVVNRATGRGKTRRVVKEKVQTAKLNKAMNIITSAPYVGGNSGVSVSDARLVGWVLSDGHLDASAVSCKGSQGKDGRRQAVRMSLAQAKFYEQAKADVLATGLSYNEYLNNSGVPVFDFSSEDSRNFLLRVGLELKNKHELCYVNWLTGLSKEALDGFLETFWLAGGHTSERRKYKGPRVFYQNKGNIFDAVHLACVLQGKNTFASFSRKCGIVRQQERSHVTMQRVTKSDRRVVDVFCLKTDNSTFLIRQGGFITITGNCNYASVYNAGAAKIAQAAGVSLKEGKTLHEAYWKLNWSVKAIAEEQVVIKDSRGRKWLVNPINGFCYALRSEADRFSTLAQGTGSYFFDMWVDNTLTQTKEKYGRQTLTGSFHDEKILCIRDSEPVKKEFEGIVRNSITMVNEQFNLRRPLGCDVQFGKRYSEIH